MGILVSDNAAEKTSRSSAPKYPVFAKYLFLLTIAIYLLLMVFEELGRLRLWMILPVVACAACLLRIPYAVYLGCVKIIALITACFVLLYDDSGAGKPIKIILVTLIALLQVLFLAALIQYQLYRRKITRMKKDSQAFKEG